MVNAGRHETLLWAAKEYLKHRSEEHIPENVARIMNENILGFVQMLDTIRPNWVNETTAPLHYAPRKIAREW